MDLSTENYAQEINRLQRCINDLVSIFALPAVWSGGDAKQIARTLLDTIVRLLQLDLVYVRVNDHSTGNEIVELRADNTHLASNLAQLRTSLDLWLVANLRSLVPHGRIALNGREFSIAAVQLGLLGQTGVLLAVTERPQFPEQSDLLILNVAANQAVLGFQEANRLYEQQRLNRELDDRVRQRTREFEQSNERLRREIEERKNVEARLLESDKALRNAIHEIRHSECKLRQVLDTIPVIAWCNMADGPNEYLNQRWREYTGLTAEESHGWGWHSAMHPEDLARLMKRWGEILVTGESDQIESRLRGRDGVYRWFLIRAEPFKDESGKIVRWYGTSTDIEDFKRTQRALQESEATLGTVINATPAMVWSTRPDGYADFFNANYLSYLGRPRDQVEGWGWTSSLHPDDMESLAEVWQRIRSAGSSGETEARMRRHDGEYRWFLMRAEPMRDETGAIIKWFGLNTDIEDRKRAEEALRASETDLRRQIDSIPGLVCTMNAVGQVEQFNRPLLEFFGKSPAELRHWGTTDAVHPDDLPRVLAAFGRAIETGTPYDVEHRCRRFDGVYLWFQVRALPVRDAHGTVTGWYVLLTDIEDRKRAEEQLVRSEEFLREGQNLARIGNFSWLVESDVIKWSEQLYQIFEFDPNEVITIEKIATRVHPEDTHLLLQSAEKARRGDSDFEYEHRLLMPDHTVKNLRVIGHALRDKDGRLEYIGAVQDVTQRNLAEAALARARTELANVSRVTSLGVLTASIAHEVNQPISGVVTNASTCLRMLAADPPNLEGARETARRAIRDGNRAAEVISRLRTLFTRRDGTIELLNLNEAIREVIALTMGEFQRSNVVLRSELYDEMPPIRGDRVQLQQVILNLLRNAADAMNNVNDRPRELVVRTQRENGTAVRLSVVDAGTGLDPETADRLFQPFYTTKPEGMGIGLSISRSIIEAHQGRLWAESNVGPGATFSFTLPCVANTKVQ